MRKALFGSPVLASLMLCVGTVCMAQVTSAPERVQVVRIGFTGPLSGSNAVIGVDALNGMQIAIDRLNQQGLEIAGKSLRFEAVIRDDQADPQRGAEVARELATAGVAAVLGPVNSGVALAAGKIYNEARVPMLTAASNPRVTQPDLPYVFRIVASDGDIGAKMAHYAARTLKLRTVGIIDDGSAYADGLIEAFQKSGRGLGLQAVAREKITEQAGEAAMSEALARLRSGGAEAIFVAAYSLQSARLIKKMRQMDMSLPVLGGDALCSSSVALASGGAVQDNTYCVLGGTWLTKVADGAVFAAGFQRKFGRVPDVYAASYYDGVMLLAQAIKSAAAIEGRQLMPALARSRYKGVNASYEFNAVHDLKESNVTILRFKGNELVPLASF